VVWDEQGQILASFQPLLGVAHVAFSPDGKRLATWTGERNAVGTVWDTTTGEAVQTWKGHVDRVVAASFTENGTRLLSVDLHGNARVWDATLKTTHRATRQATSKTTWSMDGSRQCVFNFGPVASGISVRDPAGRESLLFKEHMAPISGVQLNFDGRFAVSIDRAGTLKVWDTSTGQGAVARQWPTDNLAVTRTRPNPRFSADGRRLAMNVPEGGVKVWDLTDGVRAVFACADQTKIPLLNADGRRLATMRELAGANERNEREVTVWDVDAGEKRCMLKGRLGTLVFSSDGRRIAALSPAGPGTGLATRGIPGEARVWDTDTAAQLAHLKIDIAYGAMTFSPDGKWLAIPARSNAQAMGDVIVWDLATGKPHLRLKGHTIQVSGLTFSPDGRRIVSTAQPVNLPHGEIKFWDTATGIELLALKTNDILSLTSHLLAFSADGRRLFVVVNTGLSEWLQQWDARPRPEAQQP
jgi:WD40 repeat protein